MSTRAELHGDELITRRHLNATPARAGSTATSKPRSSSTNARSSRSSPKELAFPFPP
ncbi:hypothetical protein AB0H28_22985 [Micromonospora sp. NPDC050980]|uniref:hypothetical protein n=1 Tax=Micromonospora sp. NPDC050980 TaxID=3155161 RepID=UPI0033F785AB